MTMTAAEPTFSHHFNPAILRAYDIRGVVDETLFEADAYAVGRAFATYLLQQNDKEASAVKIAVGYDGRLSSPALADSLIAGLVDSGVTAVNVGRGPTPLLYFAVRDNALDGGIMVTGSHNPPTHNGFKMMLGKAALFGEQITELGQITARGDVVQGRGSTETLDVTDAFVKALSEGFQPSKQRPLKVAWDAGNGAAGDIMQRLVKRLPGEHIVLNEVIDGTFPAHHPDPSQPENLEQLIATVKEQQCDVGIAFDGDGDRIGAVDGNGRIIWGDQLLMLYAETLLKTQPGATVIADVKASQNLFDWVASLGGKPLIWKTGHSFIKAKMAETGAPLAGEMSGHMFFADRYYGFDDGLYAAVRLLEAVAESDLSLAEKVDILPVSYSTPELRIDVSEERKFVIIDEVTARLRAAGQEFSDIDGVRVVSTDGWWLLRASNTQAALVARCEADNEESLKLLTQRLDEQLQQSGVRLN